jgi:hypothetical protein
LHCIAEANGNRTHEQNTNTANELQQSAIPGGAESGAVGVQNGPIDPDLAAVVAAWPDLPEAVRRQVAKLVKATVAASQCDDDGFLAPRFSRDS